MATRTRRLSIMQMPPLGPYYSRNLYLFPAIGFAIVTVFICERFFPSPPYMVERELTLCMQSVTSHSSRT